MYVGVHWVEFVHNRKKPPFRVGQRVRFMSAKADQTVKIITWVSKGATCRDDQLVSINGEIVTAMIFVEAPP
jgi:hypothetical protein